MPGIITRIRRHAALAFIAAAGTALVACGPSAGGSDPTASTTATAPFTASPTPTEEPGERDDPSDPDTWVIDGEGIGPVEVHGDFDATLAEIRRTGIGELDDGQCSGVAYGVSGDNTYDVQIIADREGDTGEIVEVSVQWNGDTMGVGPRTEDGLGLGSTRAEVLAIHEGAAETDSLIEGRRFIEVGDGEVRIVFTYVDGNEGAVAVSTLVSPEPAYEPCA